MKISKLKNKRALVAAFCVVGALLVGVTIAYNKDKMFFANLFHLGSEQAVFSETFESPENWQPCQEVPKTATATNKNSTPRYVRMKYTEYWRLKNSTVDENDHETTDLPLTWDDNGVAKKYGIVNLQSEDDWELRTDGWYYYKTALGENETTSSLLKSVILNCDANLVGGITMSDDGKSGESNPSDYAGAKFHVYVEFQMSAVEWDVDPCENGVLYDHIGCISNGPDTSIKFNQSSSSTNGEGVNTVASTQNDTYPVYYYRGSTSTNNYVLWADYCWRVVRTTDTGGVKMIYAGMPNMTTGTPRCNAVGTNAQVTINTDHRFKYNTADNSYAVGYMYGNNSFEENNYDSKAKYIVEYWFENVAHLDGSGSATRNYEDDLEDTIYCNDRGYTPVNGGRGIIFGSASRNVVTTDDNYHPSVNCPSKNDSFTKSDTTRGNGKLKHKAALLTADEVTMSGAYYSAWNIGSYLYSDEYIWTMSPLGIGEIGSEISNGSGVRVFGYYYFLDDQGVAGSYNAGIRPVVSLKVGMKYDTNTTGAWNDPYIILED